VSGLAGLVTAVPGGGGCRRPASAGEVVDPGSFGHEAEAGGEHQALAAEEDVVIPEVTVHQQVQVPAPAQVTAALPENRPPGTSSSHSPADTFARRPRRPLPASSTPGPLRAGPGPAARMMRHVVTGPR
jgi:hypothetical protein